ncbi:GtrA family protein [Mesomycoplasma ovipneumoniae]|uniref:GtrA family protein n=1 Tax=Mesomycoplasma ovipneumoniae TaxID=29562 RepID=UPI003CC5C5E7
MVVLNIIPVLSTCIWFLFFLIVSYYFNSIWTFKKKYINSFVRYFIICSLGLSINVSIMFIVVDLLGSLYLIGKAVSIIIVPIFNFWLSKKWVFNQWTKIF